MGLGGVTERKDGKNAYSFSIHFRRVCLKQGMLSSECLQKKSFNILFLLHLITVNIFLETFQTEGQRNTWNYLSPQNAQNYKV